MTFYVFGSPSSIDLDVMVIVDQVSDDLEFNKRLILSFEPSILKITKSKKKINLNLAQIDSGYITKVYKGTADEVNNSLFTTYHLHPQYYSPLKIKGLLERNVDLKIVRAVRIILSLVSRTQFRDPVKKALKSDTFIDRVEALSKVDLSQVTSFGKKDSEEDVLKKIAFQIGQVLGLLEVKEYYSKEDISSAYSNLKPYLMRQSLDKTLLQQELIRFTHKIKTHCIKMNQTKE